MQIIRTFGHLIGGTLLVAGTSIGVGMLALPVATAGGGFLPSIALYILCWFFMLCTGLLVLEACIWMPKNANLITLSTELLGKWGGRVCWALYLFLFSCLMIAHVGSGAGIFFDLTGGHLPQWLGATIYVILFSPVVYFGALWVDRGNLLMMAGLILTYILFISSAVSYVTPALLARMDWGSVWLSIPVVFTAFGFQSLIPTLFNYMNRSVSRVRLSLILGTTIPLGIYIIWELLILGIIPYEGKGGLLEAFQHGQSAVAPLGSSTHNQTFLLLGQAFAFFAMTTSYWGIAIAFVDFLLDGLKLSRKGIGKALVCAGVFLTPLLITWFDPHLFLNSLRIAGGYGVALLLGAMPILMVWSGRYYKGHSLLHQQLPGGKITLSILLGFVLFEILITSST
jgi:tyrosine-specific transport protein